LAVHSNSVAVTAVAAVALSLLPGAAVPASGGGVPDVIVVRGLGTAPDNDPDPTAFDITVPLLTFGTGAPLGAVRHQPRCATNALPCFVLDDQDTYDLGAGTIVSRSRVSLSPDPAQPHLLLSSARSTVDNIVGTTGAYAGRTGRVRVAGVVDVQRFPGEYTIDEIYVIELNPRPDRS
jgi:hypothetical protein